MTVGEIATQFAPVIANEVRQSRKTARDDRKRSGQFVVKNCKKVCIRNKFDEAVQIDKINSYIKLQNSN